VVARALAASDVPTISAVGHETDFTIADFVADLRAATPSAAAELLTRDWAEWREAVAKLHARLDRTAGQSLQQHRQHLARLAGSYALREPRRVVRQWAQRLDDLRESLNTETRRALKAREDALRLLQARLAAHHPRKELEQRRLHLDHLTARLRALGPQATLDRGYALAIDAAGHPLTRAKSASPGHTVRVVLSKGVLETNVVDSQADRTLLDALKPALSPAKKPPGKKSAPQKKKT